MTLTEFLLARIAEDEAEARDDDGSPTPVGMWDPDRVLAECEAKRRIVEDEHFGDVNGGCYLCNTTSPCGTLRLLARPYADHPDYREEWRPS